MKNLIIRIIRFLLVKPIGTGNYEKLILLLARLAQIDLLMLAYHNIGILKYWNSAVSGEDFVINNLLKKYLNKEQLTMFDVGANIGEYSMKLRDAFPQAIIYAFEPNPNSFELMNNNLDVLDINCYQLGLSSNNSNQKIYTYAANISSEHASIYKDVLLDLHKANEIIEIEFTNIKLDDFCEDKQIGSIDFLKIDTEGHELEVLRGALKNIYENNISIIQFEFNEMNIISRVFLKDYYDLLTSNYVIYRIDSDKLIPLIDYSSTNEIFKYQNLLAINKKIALLN
jgi:FkbM family methyltransferase